jgi:hypothetical protein
MSKAFGYWLLAFGLCAGLKVILQFDSGLM